jgi:hypothetical protein
VFIRHWGPYLTATKIEVGLLINFGSATLGIQAEDTHVSRDEVPTRKHDAVSPFPDCARRSAKPQAILVIPVHPVQSLFGHHRFSDRINGISRIVREESQRTRTEPQAIL